MSTMKHRRCYLALAACVLCSCAGVSKPEPVGALGYALNGTTSEKPVEKAANEPPPAKSSGQLRWQMKF